ncbi:MAG TPA: hypothetical protein VFG46_10225 [Chryseolinea sp.]|jgi:hypothetical protein|nr:hypothetical protein [Chryseolinea sp.]
MKISLVILFLLSHFITHGQHVDSLEKKNDNITLNVPSLRFREPLFILSTGGLEVEVQREEIFGDALNINSRLINSIYVYKDAEATEKYGRRGENGVVVISVSKDKANLLPFQLRQRLKLED